MTVVVDSYAGIDKISSFTFQILAAINGQAHGPVRNLRQGQDFLNTSIMDEKPKLLFVVIRNQVKEAGTRAYPIGWRLRKE